MYFLFVQIISAQVGINTANPNPNAALEVASDAATKIGGFMPPTVSIEQRNAIPVTAADDGLMVYVKVPCGNRRLQLFNGVLLKWEDVLSMEVPFKVWNFGNDIVTWPPSGGTGSLPIIVDNIGLFPPVSPDTDFGRVNNGAATFSDGFTAPRRFQMGGAGFPLGFFDATPDRRHIFMDVSGPCRIKVWFSTNANNAVRTLFVTDGALVLGSETTNSGGNNNFAILEATYTGGPRRLYVFGDSSCNLYKLEVCGAIVNTNL